MTRTVIDTNELLRMAAGGERSQLAQHWRNRRLELLVSLSTLTELRTVLARPDIQRYFDPVVADEFLSLLERHATVVQPDLSAPACRDPGDTALIATAVGGRADFLVSADPDLLDDPDLIHALAKRGIRVVRAAEFLAHLASSPAAE